MIVVIAAAIAKAVSDLLSSLLSSVSGGPIMAKGAGIAILVFGAFAALDQDRHADLLDRFGLDPKELLGRFTGGGMPGS